MRAGLVVAVAASGLGIGVARDLAAPITEVQGPVGQISGLVLDGAGQQPVADARVTLRRVYYFAAGSPEALLERAPLAVLTASNGAFLLRDVAAGEYTLMASKAGYVSGFFGQQSSRDDSLQHFDLRAGENVASVVLRVWPGGTIAGRVMSASGKPVPGRWVQLLDVNPDNGMPQLRSSAVPFAVQTDDRGEYWLSRVKAGLYLVQILTRFPGLPFDGPPIKDLDASCVFYPNAALPIGAQVIEIAEGEERTGVDFELPDPPQPVFTIRGRVEGLSSSSYGRKISLVLTDGTADVPAHLEVGSASVEPDGSFFLNYVPNGTYELRGVAVPDIAWGGDIRQGPSGLRFGSAVPPLPVPPLSEVSASWFSERVTVRDTSITDLVLQARTGARVLGKIELSPELATLDLSQVAITARPLDGWDLEGFPVGRVAGDGTFASAALPTGKYIVLPHSPGAWFAESAVFQGADVLGTGIEIGNSDAAGLMVTLSSRKAQVTGKVMDSAGKVRPDAHVLFFRKGGRWLTSGLNMSPDIGNIRTNRFGEYVAQLSAGEYFVTAIAGDIPEGWRDLGFLQSLIPKAAAIAVARGATRIENLQVQVLRK